MNCNNSTL